jgi:hypothetical protein
MVLVVGLTLLPFHLSHCCFTKTMFRRRHDDQTRNCQTGSWKSRVRGKLVQIMLQILFSCLYPSKTMSSVSLKADWHGSWACFQRRSYTSPKWQRQVPPQQCSQIFPSHSVPAGLLKTKCLEPLHIKTHTVLFFFFFFLQLQ